MVNISFTVKPSSIEDPKYYLEDYVGIYITRMDRTHGPWDLIPV